MKKIIFCLTMMLLNIFAINKSYANTIFFDDFNGNDGTHLTIHDTFWQALTNQDFGILSNNKVKSSDSANAGYYVPSLNSLTDYCVQADFTYPLPQTFPPDFFALTTRNNSTNTQFYDGGISVINGTFLQVSNGTFLYKANTSIPNGQHTFKLCSIGTKQIIYIDNNIITSSNDNLLSSGSPGFELGNNTPIDNFTVNTIDPADLPVPLFKQTSSPWQSQEYDSAHVWNPSNTTINAWGCALTSAAMIFSYYGINELPDGTLLDPGSLNAWLKNQPDGYVETGWVNWLALARLSKLATNINHITFFDALEYNRISGANTTQLTTDLNNGYPDILEEPGHFIVAKGINDATFDINDPYYNRSTLNDGYNNTFLSLGEYTPSYTDLSYIMIVTDPDTTLTVTNNNGITIGTSFVQSPIHNSSKPANTNSPIKIYYLPKPNTGNYSITTNNATNNIKVTSYLYDQQGNPKIQMLTGFGKSAFTLSYDKSNSSHSTIRKTVTFNSTIQDIKDASSMHVINNALALSLITIVKDAQTQAVKHPTIAKTILEGGIKLLDQSKNYPILISQNTYSILLEDFTVLNETLK